MNCCDYSLTQAAAAFLVLLREIIDGIPWLCYSR